jgi:hypothetical protein
MILDSQAFADALEEDRDNNTARQGKPKKKHDSQKTTKKKVRFDDT